MTVETQDKVLEDSFYKKNPWIIRALGIILFLVGITVILFALNNYESEFIADPNDPYNTVQAFAYSLAFNKLDNIKSFVSSDKWDFIEKWSNYHRPVSPDCKTPADPDAHGMSIGSYDEIANKHSINSYFNMECPDYYYTFSVEGVVVEQIDNKWQIIDWEKICEEKAAERCY